MANMNQQQQQNRQPTNPATSTSVNKAADTRQAAREEQLRKTNVHFIIDQFSFLNALKFCFYLLFFFRLY